MEKKIKRVGYHDENGNPQEIVVGRYGVVEIKEHQAQGEGDKWYYEVVWEDGKGRMIFDPKVVDYENPNPTKGEELV